MSWISRWHIGMAAHGEQGVEGIHKVFNQLNRNMAGIRDPLKRMLATMVEHLITTDPDLRKEIPEIKTMKEHKVR